MREPVFPCAIELPEAAGGRLTALHRQLRGAIVSGRLPAGFALPSTRVAAMSLGVARNTVAKAYDLLVAEGYVRARRGARATVQDLGLRPGASGPGDPQPQRLLNHSGSRPPTASNPWARRRCRISASASPTTAPFRMRCGAS